jgi:hypothetical protein
MSKHKNPLLETLRSGSPYTFTISEGGDLASMRAAFKHGQTVTIEPLTDPSQVQPGDIVYLRWHASHILHIVKEIQGDQFLIVNSLGKINGWATGSDLLGRVTRIIDPEPRPSVPEMLDQLEAAYRGIIERYKPNEPDSLRLLAIVGDLRWYAERLGDERLDRMPRSNKWSFAQNLWYFTCQAQHMAPEGVDEVIYFIDRGKTCVGLGAEILALFEYGQSY